MSKTFVDVGISLDGYIAGPNGSPQNPMGGAAMRIHETITILPPHEVLSRARAFFAHAGSSYASFEEHADQGYVKLFLEVGEIVIGTVPAAEGTRVRGSASRGEHLLTRFLTTLSAPGDLKQSLHRHGRHEERAALVDRTPGARSALRAAA